MKLERQQKVFEENGYKLECGPSDQQGRKTVAGVAIAALKDIKFFKEPLEDNLLKEVEQAGRVQRYTLDLGWPSTVAVYVVYGKAGGSKKAKGYTEAVQVVF